MKIVTSVISDFYSDFWKGSRLKERPFKKSRFSRVVLTIVDSSHQLNSVEMDLPEHEKGSMCSDSSADVFFSYRYFGKKKVASKSPAQLLFRPFLLAF